MYSTLPNIFPLVFLSSFSIIEYPKYPKYTKYTKYPKYAKYTHYAKYAHCITNTN